MKAGGSATASSGSSDGYDSRSESSFDGSFDSGDEDADTESMSGSFMSESYDSHVEEGEDWLLAEGEDNISSMLSSPDHDFVKSDDVSTLKSHHGGSLRSISPPLPLPNSKKRLASGSGGSVSPSGSSGMVSSVDFGAMPDSYASQHTAAANTTHDSGQPPPQQ